MYYSKYYKCRENYFALLLAREGKRFIFNISVTFSLLEWINLFAAQLKKKKNGKYTRRSRKAFYKANEGRNEKCVSEIRVDGTARLKGRSCQKASRSCDGALANPCFSAKSHVACG